MAIRKTTVYNNIEFIKSYDILQEVDIDGEMLKFPQIFSTIVVEGFELL